jgi:hypothetical protein
MALDTLGGSWIVESGALATYTPVGGGKYAAAESIFNFDWTLGGAKPSATHSTTWNGVVEEDGDNIKYVLIGYVLDKDEKAVYILKVVGDKILKDPDTISVENSVVHVYNTPTCNPVTDVPDFTIPASGTFPPVREYRIKG